jgi:hypothetical protein
MTQNFQNELQCSQFEALLADALDGERSSLTADVRQAFDAHGKTCPLCGPLWIETQQGMLLLRSLEEQEPPKNLVHNILAATSMQGQETVVLGRNDAPREKTGWLVRVRRSISYAPLLLRSRFATSFVMAFFSLSVTLSLAGVRIGDVSKIDWHPTALRKSVVLQYTQVESRVQRYYENMRLVYEVESRVRGIKKAVAPSGEGEGKKDDNKQEHQNRNTLPDTSGTPREHDTYSQEREDSLQLAAYAPGHRASGNLMKYASLNHATYVATKRHEGAQI